MVRRRTNQFAPGPALCDRIRRALERADATSKTVRECEGVEPSRDNEGRPATVLKTARPTGTHPLPMPTYVRGYARATRRRVPGSHGGRMRLRARIFPPAHHQRTGDPHVAASHELRYHRRPQR